MNEGKVIKLVRTVDRNIMSGEGFSDNGDAWLHPEVAEEEEFDKKVRLLVNRLAAKQDFSNVGNFYADSDIKRLNLIKYFRALFWLKPDWMLVGEAPGIHGCVKTGIPFTSCWHLRIVCCCDLFASCCMEETNVFWGSVHTH